MTIETPMETTVLERVELPFRLPTAQIHYQPRNSRYEQKPVMEKIAHHASKQANCVVKSTKINTFDQVAYRNQFTPCYSVLAKDCGSEKSEPRFVVLMKKINEKKEWKNVKVVYGENEIEMYKTEEGLICRVNGEEIEYQPESEIEKKQYNIIWLNKNTLKFDSDDVTVQFDGVNARIHLSALYRNQQCGLCGHYDNEKETEFYDGLRKMTPTKPKVYIVGVGMTKFCKPGSVPGWDYPDMVKEAVTTALDDCKMKYSDIQQATVGYLFGGTCCGQRALYEVGLTGIPIFNVNNACASGSSGLFLGKQIIESGNSDVVLCAGFERMAPGSLENLAAPIDDRALSVDKHISVMSETYGLEPAPMTAQMFGNAAKEHMEKYGSKREHYAKIAYKNHLHSVHNPKSQFTKEFSLDQVINARKIYDFMGLLECSPTSDGAAAAVLVSEKFLEKNPRLKAQAVEIVGLKLGTDEPSVFAENSNIKMIGFDMIQKLAKQLWAETKLTPNDVQVIELHDCFAPNELITYEAIGLCPVGQGHHIVDRNDNTYGGKWVINPSGGLISKGHPIGATGVAQAVELSNQLRGKCGKRQVPNCKVAMQHNIGIGGAGVVGLYRLGFPGAAQSKI